MQVLLRRRKQRQATEMLMNFSMMAVWRLGGHERSPKGNENALRRFDEVCGGPWWREHFADAAASADREAAAGDAIETAAAEYSRRLTTRTGMRVQSVGVSHGPRKRAVYRLVFATRSPYGLWVFGDTAAKARAEWWKTVELRAAGEEMTLFPSTPLMRPDPKEVEARAVPRIAANLEALLARERGPVKLVRFPLEVFGDFYGQVTKSAARKAVQLPHAQGKTPTDGSGVSRIRRSSSSRPLPRAERVAVQDLTARPPPQVRPGGAAASGPRCGPPAPGRRLSGPARPTA